MRKFYLLLKWIQTDVFGDDRSVSSRSIKDRIEHFSNSRIARSTLIALFVLGGISIQLVGYPRYWLLGKSEREAFEQYQKDYAAAKRISEARRMPLSLGGYDDSYYVVYVPPTDSEVSKWVSITDVRQVRAHGRPFGAIFSHRTKIYSETLSGPPTAWLFDRTHVLEIRVWPIIGDVAFSLVIVLLAIRWIKKTKPIRIRFQYSTTTIIIVAYFTTRVLITGSPNYGWPNYDITAPIGFYLAMLVTFVALISLGTSLFSLVARNSLQPEV